MTFKVGDEILTKSGKRSAVIIAEGDFTNPARPGKIYKYKVKVDGFDYNKPLWLQAGINYHFANSEDMQKITKLHKVLE